MRLSKSTFVAWQRCPHTAWYRVNDRALFETFVDPATRVLMVVGNEIDALARRLFPGGLLLGRGQARETTAAIRRREPVIFQGEFVTDDLVMLADVLVWNAATGAYDIVEVKSSTSTSTRHDAEYVMDLAIQEHVLRACDAPVGKTYLMRLNSDYVRHGVIDIEKLFASADFSDEVAAVRPGLAADIADAHRWINSKTAPKGPCPCLRLSRGNHCEMFSHINPGVPDYSVHDIARINGGKLATLVDAGILEISDVPGDFPISDKQATQVRLAKTGQPEIDRGSIATFMSAIELPAAFLDFETHNPPCRASTAIVRTSRSRSNSRCTCSSTGTSRRDIASSCISRRASPIIGSWMRCVPRCRTRAPSSSGTKLSSVRGSPRLPLGIPNIKASSTT